MILFCLLSHAIKLMSGIATATAFGLQASNSYAFPYCRAKEMEFKDAIGDMGRQLTKAKIDANLREMNLLAAAQEREEQLRKELDDLRALLQSEKSSQATK